MVLNMLIQHFEKIPAFVMVAYFRSITNASRHLSLSQAAISQSLKRLEDALGRKLFVRSKNGICLTKEGEILYEGAKKLLKDIEKLQAEVLDYSNSEFSLLRLGTHETLAIHYWPKIIEFLNRNSSPIGLSIMSGRIDQLCSEVINKELDAILTVKPNLKSNIRSILIYSDTLEFYTSQHTNINILKKSSLSLDDLKEFPVLTDSQAHLAENKPISKILMDLGLLKNHYFKLNSFQAAAQLAAKDLGVALLPKKIIPELGVGLSLKKINVKGIDKKKFKHSVYLTFHQSYQNHKGIKNLIETLKKYEAIL